MKKLALALAVIAAVLVAAVVLYPGHAASFINSIVGVCDASTPANCLKPNADGSINTSGGGPITVADGADVTQGAKADAAYVSGSGSVVSILKGIFGAVTGATPAGSAIIGKVGIDQTTPGTTNGVQVNAALPAGANLIGKTGIDQTTPGTTNGVNIAPNAAAAVGITPVLSGSLESCHVLKASAGNLYKLNVTIQAVSGIVEIYNAISAPADGAVTPAWFMPVLSNGTFGGGSWDWQDIPLVFSTGITVCFSSATTPFTKTASATAAFSGAVK